MAQQEVEVQFDFESDVFDLDDIGAIKADTIHKFPSTITDLEPGEFTAGAFGDKPRAAKSTTATSVTSLRDGETVGPQNEGGFFDSFSALKIQHDKDVKKRRFDRSIRRAIGVGNKYDAETRFTGKFKGLGAQIDMSRSVDLHNKQKKFYESFPEGGLIQVPTVDGLVTLARENGSEPYRRLSIEPKIIGGVFSAPVVLGTIGSLFTSVGTGIGTAAGILIDEEIEALRGFPSSRSGSFQDASIEGVKMGAIDFIFRRAARVFLGKVRTVGDAKALKAAMDTAKKYGLEPLSVGQVGGPFVRGLFRQTGAVSARLEKLTTSQREGILRLFEERGAIVPGSVPDQVLIDVINAQTRELETMLFLKGGGKRLAFGQAIDDGIKKYTVLTRVFRDKLYKDSLAKSTDVIYYMEPAQSMALSLKTGVQAKGAPIIEKSSILDASGKAIEKEIIPSIQVSGKLQAELSSVIDDILAMDINVSKHGIEGGEWLAFEQIKSLRTRLWNMSQSNEGSIRGQSRQLWKTLTEVMDNPISASPAFMEAYRGASAFNWIRENTLKISYVARIARSDTPAEIAATYYNPGHALELSTLRDMVPKGNWAVFREGFMADVAASPTATAGITRLRNFRATDRDGLRILLNHSEEKELMRFLTRRAQFESSPAYKMMGKQLEEGEAWIAFAKEGTAGQLADAVRLSGGLTSNYAIAARAGVYKDIMNKATVVTETGIEAISIQKLSVNIQEWIATGKLKHIMNEADLIRLADVRGYAAMLSDTIDAGGAMMAGQMRSQTMLLIRDIAKGKIQSAETLAQKILSINATAWILARRAKLGRVGVDRLPIRELRNALTIAMNQISRTDESKVPNVQKPKRRIKGNRGSSDIDIGP